MDKKTLRPQVRTAPINSSSNGERFQNTTLRPIIKLQHDLIIACFNYHVKRKKVIIKSTLDQRILEKQLRLILLKDLQLKADLTNLIVGLFTIEEYQEYLLSRNEINKRISKIIEERIVSIFLK
jgi:hypothetical protein